MTNAEPDAKQTRAYEVHVVVHSTLVIEVKAINEEQAIEAAQREWVKGDPQPDDPYFADWMGAEAFIEGEEIQD